MSSPPSQTQPHPAETVYYETTSLCPFCRKLLPARVVGRSEGVFVCRTCPEHGLLEGLTCSDRDWYDRLPAFDVEPIKPARAGTPAARGCPADCGLCDNHRQIAGTVAIEISNICNLSCPVCLADNAQTFELTVAEVSRMADDLLARQPHVDAFTISGGEPTIHPQIFEILEVLDRPGINRIVLNTNGLRLAEDAGFASELARHPKVYVCLHYDGQAATPVRAVDPSVQERALRRLLELQIPMVPLVLGVAGQAGINLGPTVHELLVRSPLIRSVMISMMAYVGNRGADFPGNPRQRLTIPSALQAIEYGTGGVFRKGDFMPLPMPNPLCAAIGYFLVEGTAILPLLPLLPQEEAIHHTRNAHFLAADGRFESLLRGLIDRCFAQANTDPLAKKALPRLRAFLETVFPAAGPLPEAERRRLAEERIKTVYLMQFMDPWTFDTKRMQKCSCQHLLPDGRVIPSCGYYSYHRAFDPRFPGH